MHKIWHIAIQWVITEELSDFKHFTDIGCYHCHKSVHEISALLDLPYSTVSAVIVKWKCLGAMTAQSGSGSLCKFIEWGHRVLKSCLSSIATLNAEFQTASGSNISARTVRWELHEVGFHGRAAVHPRSLCTMLSIGWSGVTHTITELWSSLLWSDKSHFSIWQSERRIYV